MKARLVPLYLDPGRDADFDKQLAALHSLLAEKRSFCEPVALGAPVPAAEAVVFPQVLGEAYRQVAAFQVDRLADPADHLRIRHAFDVGLGNRRISAFAGRRDDRTLSVCSKPGMSAVRWASRRELRRDEVSGLSGRSRRRISSRVSSNDSTGGKTSARERLADKFGVTIVKKSFRELGAAAKAIPDERPMRHGVR